MNAVIAMQKYVIAVLALNIIVYIVIRVMDAAEPIAGTMLGKWILNGRLV